jgi:glyoxylase-like metal-dependent hydrolase (beta-lactamase superfamily II)
MKEITHDHKKISNGITIFQGMDNEGKIYLIEGKTAALLIDTGFGVTDLAGEIRTVTGLPLTVVNTHGHGDHSGGNNQFSEVYLHERAAREAGEALELNKTVLPPDLWSKAEEAYRSKTTVQRFISERFSFDLGGGRKIEVVEIPGHTPGCICLIDSMSGLVFTGDCLVKSMDILLVVPSSLPVTAYLSSMEKLLDRSSRFAGLCTGHDAAPLPVSFLCDAVVCARQIIAGKAAAAPVELPAVYGDTAACRAVFGDASILYRPSKIC